MSWTAVVGVHMPPKRPDNRKSGPAVVGAKGTGLDAEKVECMQIETVPKVGERGPRPPQAEEDHRNRIEKANSSWGGRDCQLGLGRHMRDCCSPGSRT